MLTYDEHGNVVRDKIILTRGTLQKIIDTIKSEIAHAYKWLFPVGFIWSTSKAPTNGGDPNILFPGTTWVRLEGAFICAAGDNDTVDSDPEHDTPHGSDIRSAADLPSHRHPINNASGKTGAAGAATGSVSKLLYKGDQSLSVSGIFSATNQSGSWYGYSYIPNGTTFVKMSYTADAHKHELPDATQTNTSNLFMSIIPKNFSKYYWERTL